MRVQREYPGGKFPVLKGLFFTADTWDGSDWFMPTSCTGCMFATTAVKKVFDDFAVTNVRFKRLDEVELIPLDGMPSRIVPRH